MKRICNCCDKEIKYEGYVIDDGSTYYCSKKCLHKHISKEDYLEMYEEGLAYYTSFDEDEE